MTPLYDIMSAYPTLGHGDKLMPPKKLKLAMAFSGKNRHYEWAKIEPRHLRETARRCGMESSIDTILNRPSTDVPRIVTELSSTLPRGFPASIADPIIDGLEKQRRFFCNSI